MQKVKMDFPIRKAYVAKYLPLMAGKTWEEIAELTGTPARKGKRKNEDTGRREVVDVTPAENAAGIFASYLGTLKNNLAKFQKRIDHLKGIVADNEQPKKTRDSARELLAKYTDAAEQLESGIATIEEKAAAMTGGATKGTRGKLMSVDEMLAGMGL